MSFHTESLDTSINLDPKIIAKQNDWEDILTNEALILPNDRLAFRDPNFSLIYHLKYAKLFTLEDRGRLCQIWFQNAINGTSIFYPKSTDQLLLYEVHSSWLLSSFVNTVSILLFLSPLLQNNICSYGYNQNSSFTGEAFAVLFGALIHSLDLYLSIITSHWTLSDEKVFNTFRIYQVSNVTKMDNTRFWMIARGVSIFAILINSIGLFLGSLDYKVTLAFVPILYIARRSNFREIVEGISLSMKRTIKILQLQLFIIIIWAFMGWCLFRRYNTDGHFENFFASLYTCFHCVLSRPTVLYRLLPIFSDNNYAAIFFVSLTFIADIICASLIIAVGTRNFRNFSQINYKARLKNRKLNLQSIFRLYCDEQGYIYQDEFIVFGKDLGRSYRIHKIKYSELLFQTEENQQRISERQFFRLSAAIASNLQFLTSSQVQTKNLIYSLANSAEQPYEVIDSLKTLSTIAGNVMKSSKTDIKTRASVHRTVEWKKIVTPRNLKVTSNIMDIPLHLRQYSAKNAHIPPIILQSTIIDTGEDVPFDGIIEETERPSEIIRYSLVYMLESSRNSLKPVKNLTKNLRSWYRRMYDHSEYLIYNYELDLALFEISKICFYLDWYEFQIPLDLPFRLWNMNTSKPSLTSTKNDECKEDSLHQRQFSEERSKSNAFRSTSVASEVFMDSTATTNTNWTANSFSDRKTTNDSGPDSWTLHIRAISMFMLLLYISLLIDMAFLTSESPTSPTVPFAWIILMGFFLLNLVQVMAKSYSKLYNRLQLLLNFANFIALACLGTDTNNFNQVTLTILTLIQSSRFIKFFEFVPRAEVFTSIIPIIIRVGALLLLVIYAYSIVGHISLCKELDANAVDNVSDDAKSWSGFASILNFDTFLSSLYTMSEMVVLSNWSMIMDAAVVSYPQFSGYIYIFFFSFRILTVIVILPLAMSFIIQSFIQQLRKYSRNKQLAYQSIQKHRQEIQKRLGVDFNYDTYRLRFLSIFKPSKPPFNSLRFYSISSKDELFVSSVLTSLWSSNGLETVSKVKSNDDEDTTDFLQNKIEVCKEQVEGLTQICWQTLLIRIRSHQQNYCNVLEKPELLRHEQKGEDDADVDEEDKDKSQYNIMHDTGHESLRQTETMKQCQLLRQHVDNYCDVHYFVAEADIIQIQKEWVTLLRNEEAGKFTKNTAETYSISSRLKKQDKKLEQKIVRSVKIKQSIILRMRSKLNSKEIGRVGRLWFHSALHGMTIHFPFSSTQISAMEFASSKLFTNLLRSVVVLQMISVFLIIPRCVNSSDYSSSGVEWTVSYQSLSIFDALCVSVYLWDILLDLHTRDRMIIKATFIDYFRSWTMLRLVCSIWILFECVVNLLNETQNFLGIRLIRCLYPLLVISRSDTYQDMLKGISAIVVRTIMVYQLLITILFVFTLMGYYLFQRFLTNANRFSSIISSLSTIVHCSTSAPFSLYVVAPYAEISSASELFFVALTYSTEVLCISLIVAVGNSYYAIFSDKNLKERLRKRIHNLIALWNLFSDPNTGTMAIEDWLKLSKSFQSKYKIDDDDARHLYSYVLRTTYNIEVDAPFSNSSTRVSMISDQEGTIGSESYHNGEVVVESGPLRVELSHPILLSKPLPTQRQSATKQSNLRVVRSSEEHEIMCSTLANLTSPFSSVSDLSTGSSITSNSLESKGMHAKGLDEFSSVSIDSNWKAPKIEALYYPPINRYQFIRLISLLYVGARVKPCNSQTEVEEIHRKIQNNESITDEEEEVGTQPIFNEVSKSTERKGMDLKSKEIALRAIEKKANVKEEMVTQDPSEDVLKEKHEDNLEVTEDLDEEEVKKTIEGIVHGHKMNVLYIKEKQNYYFRPALQWRSHMYNWWVTKLSSAISIEIYSNTITLYELISLIMHGLLILQLGYFTAVSSNYLPGKPWLQFGYFLEAYFLLEMIVRCVVLGVKRYLRNSMFQFITVINICSFASMIAMGNDTASNDTAYLFTILFQCIRLLFMLWIERGDDRLKQIASTSVKVVFLLFSVIYFFSIIAQDAFCGASPANLSDDSTNTTVNFASGLMQYQGTNSDLSRHRYLVLADDDAGNWAQFYTILNFDTYLQTMFTLFQVMVLGSWSMIMDGVAQYALEPKLTRIFFFILRLSITLLFLPILMSFIIRSFIMLNDEYSKTKVNKIATGSNQARKTTSAKTGDAVRTSETASPTQSLRFGYLLPYWNYFQRYYCASQWSSQHNSRRRRFNTDRYLTKHSIQIDKHNNNIAFISIWDTSGGAGVSFSSEESYMKILKLSNTLENLKSDVNFLCTLVDLIKHSKIFGGNKHASRTNSSNKLIKPLKLEKEMSHRNSIQLLNDFISQQRLSIGKRMSQLSTVDNSEVIESEENNDLLQAVMESIRESFTNIVE